MKIRTRRYILLTALAVTVSALGVTTVIAVSDSIPTPKTVHTLPSPEAAQSARPAVYSGPVALTVKATSTMTFTPDLQPADFVNVFQLVDPAHGYYAIGGTTYLIAHSYAKGFGAPGNEWEKLTIGQVVSYGGADFRINYISTPAKGALIAEPIWGSQDPNALVMITCTSRGPGNPATNNFVIRLERI